MSWFKFLQKSSDKNPNTPIGNMIVKKSSSEFGSDPLEISIFAADGGFVLQTSGYDKINDRYHKHLVIINDSEEDISKVIGDHITLAMFRRS